MKIELNKEERLHLSFLIAKRRDTIEKILNAIENDNGVITNYYERENKLMDEINKKLFRKE